MRLFSAPSLPACACSCCSAARRRLPPRRCRFAHEHALLLPLVAVLSPPRPPQEGRRFCVVVADARPQLEGRRLLRQLLSGGISCEYVYLNALSFSLDRITKVRWHCF